MTERITWSKPPREENATDKFYLYGYIDGRHRGSIYSIGSAAPILRDLTRIEAKWGFMRKSFPRTDEGLEHAKIWCDGWAEREELENRRKDEARCQ